MQLLISTVKIFVLPPGCLLLLALVGWLARRRWPRLGTGAIAASLLLLYAFSTPLCSGVLHRGLEIYPALAGDDLAADAGAIVVLSADVYFGAPEYAGDTVGPTTLERVRYAAWLHRATGGVPLLTTGGRLFPARITVGEAMAVTLREDFGIPVRWIESASQNTYENATMSRAILEREGIRKIYLVTSASHMRRSVAVFEAIGFEVVPAPTDLVRPLGAIPGDFLPRAKPLYQSTEALYEWIGLVWYHLVYI